MNSQTLGNSHRYEVAAARKSHGKACRRNPPKPWPIPIVAFVASCLISIAFPPTVLAAGNASLFITQDVPSAMKAGEVYEVSVTFRNTGTKTWTTAKNYKLQSQNPANNTTWGVKKVHLAGSDAIATGQQKKFVWTVTAPATAGTYDCQWRMRKGSLWFGPLTPNVAVTVDDGEWEEPDDTGEGGGGGGGGDDTDDCSYVKPCGGPPPQPPPNPNCDWEAGGREVTLYLGAGEPGDVDVPLQNRCQEELRLEWYTVPMNALDEDLAGRVNELPDYRRSFGFVQVPGGGTHSIPLSAYDFDPPIGHEQLEILARDAAYLDHWQPYEGIWINDDQWGWAFNADPDR